LLDDEEKTPKETGEPSNQNQTRHEMANLRCDPRPVRKIPGLPFGKVTDGGDRSFSNLAISNVLSVGSQAVIPILYVEDIAARENLNVTVCEDFELAANNITLAANNNVLISGANVEIVGNFLVPNLQTCNLTCADGNLDVTSDNTIAFATNLASFTNNVNIVGTLNVCDIICTGQLMMNAPIILVNNDLTIQDQLNVLGDATVAGNLYACNIVCNGGNLSVTSDNTITFTTNDASFTGNVDVGNNLVVGDFLNVAGNANIDGLLNVCAIDCPGGNLNISAANNITFATNNATFTNDVNVVGDLIVSGTINANVTAVAAQAQSMLTYNQGTGQLVTYGSIMQMNNTTYADGTMMGFNSVGTLVNMDIFKTVWYNMLADEGPYGIGNQVIVSWNNNSGPGATDVSFAGGTFTAATAGYTYFVHITLSFSALGGGDYFVIQNNGLTVAVSPIQVGATFWSTGISMDSFGTCQVILVNTSGTPITLNSGPGGDLALRCQIKFKRLF
jgi:hypothetical protein